MDTNFEEVKMRLFSDRYGLFTVGTKREQMERMGNSLFYHPLRKFDRTDKNKNGVIESDELLSRIKKEKTTQILSGSLCTLLTAAFAGGLSKVSKYYGIAAMLFGLGLNAFAAYVNFSEAYKMNNKITVLNKYIKLQEAEGAAK